MKDIKISDNIEVSSKLDEYILKGLDDGIEIKSTQNLTANNNKKHYLKIAMMVLAISGATITSAYAIDKIIDYFNYNKDSIYKYEEEKMQEHVQVINKSVKHDGVEFRLDTVVADDSYIVLNYTVTSDKKISELEYGEELVKNISMANPFVRLLRNDQEVFDGGNMETEATFVSDYQLKGMIRHRVGRHNIEDEEILTVDTWEVFTIEKDWHIDFKLDKKSTKNNSHKYEINKSQTISNTMEYKGEIVKAKNKFTVDNVTISPLGNLITITEEVEAPESDNLPYIGDRFVLLDEANNHLDVLSSALKVPDKPNKPITSSYEFLLNNKNIKSMTLVPIEYEDGVENKLLNFIPINKLPMKFEISKYGKIIIDNFEISENQIRYTYKKEGIIPYLSDLILCDENGEILFFENSFSKKSVDRENNKVDVIIDLETKKDKEIAKKIKKVTLCSDEGLKLIYDKKIEISLDK